MNKRDKTAIRFIRFWGTLLVFNYLKSLTKIPQSEEGMHPIAEIYDRIMAATVKHGLID